MTDTEAAEVEPSAFDPGDTVPVDLRNWGLTGQPVSWAFVNWQPVVAAIRKANRGELSAADVQPLLDATFPDAGYSAGDVVLAHPPVGEFTATPSGLAVEFVLDGDEDLGLPDANVEWDFGDGTAVVRSHTGRVHGYPGPGTYRARLSVLVAGTVVQSEQDVVVAGGAPPVLTSLDPNLVIVGSAPVTLRVLGSGFADTSVIVFNGGDEPTTFVSPTEVTTGVQPTTASGFGTVPIQVRDPGGLSNTLGFDFRGYVPPGGGDEPDEPEPPEGEEPEPPEAEEFDPDEEFDPGEHTVDEVLAYAAAHPEYTDDIIAAEEAGKARVGILDKL